MLTGKLPYGAQIARKPDEVEHGKLKIRRRDDDRDVPVWIDGALRKALHPEPNKRHEELSEFTFELRDPNADYLDTRTTPADRAQSVAVLEADDGNAGLRRRLAAGAAARALINAACSPHEEWRAMQPCAGEPQAEAAISAAKSR